MTLALVPPRSRSPVDPRPASGRGPRADEQDAGLRVIPWATVLPLAVVLAFANTFVVIAMRGSVGASGRTQQPFLAWLLESSLLVPLFTLSMLVVLARVRRRYGPHPYRGRPMVGAGLRVAGAGAATGIAVLFANAWLDQHLQIEHLDEHMRNQGTCFSQCVEQLSEATLVLQAQAVGWGSLILLVTNVVVVAWLLALRGGQLRLVPRGDGDGRVRTSPHRDAGVLLTLSLAGAGLIHAAVVADHLEEWWVEGAFFVLLAAAQLGVAVLVVRGAHRTTLLLAVAVSAGPLALWLVSRIVGIPVGPEPWEPEGIGLADATCALLEQATVLLALSRLRGSTALHRYHSSAASWRLAVVAMLTLTTLGLGSGFAALGSGHDHGEDETFFDWTAGRESHPRPAGPA